MDKTFVHLWLNITPEVGTKKIAALETYFGDLEEAWHADNKELAQVPSLRQKDYEALLSNRDESIIEEYLKKLEKLSIQFVTVDDDMYPNNLAHIFEPPSVLYFKGNFKDVISKDMIGVVGARKCSPYGRHIAHKICKDLVLRDLVIVSGMARGIDTAAHKGAIEGGGETIAVMGCGLDRCYPKENNNLMNEIIDHGLVLSEYPLGMPPLAKNFPRRNRIISALSRCLVVAEAAKKSGSIITADLALEQGKDVYAIPGSILSETSKGTNWLLKQGARVLTSAEDIFMDFGLINDTSNESFQTKLKIELAKDEKMIYDNLGLEPLHIDVLCKMTNMTITDVQHVLTLLEIQGYIEQLPGKRFIKKM